MRILIATVKVPFVRGGAEILAEGLLDAVRAQGHEAEIVAIPFKWYPPERILEQALACRLLDVSESGGARIDRVIGLKFPAYLMPHAHKVLWLLHQFRTAYELWDNPYGDLHRYPNGVQVRESIQRMDRCLIPESKAVFTISKNVSSRLWRYCGVDSIPLYHPPVHADLFYVAEAEDYFFFPSRLAPLKRQALVLEALTYTRRPACVRFAGAADEAPYADELAVLGQRLNVAHRVEWLGPITEEQKRALYARALGVIFPPVDEDYGYVTLEAMLAAKPLITCKDSGAPLEFVQEAQTGLIAGPTPQDMALAMDTLWEDRAFARALGEAGKRRYESLEISWATVVERLLSCD
jgi:glycosyltransferase involved in cell wall biosynthesis